MKTIDEIREQVKRGSENVELDKIEEKIRSAEFFAKENYIDYVFEYNISDKESQMYVIEELEAAGYKVTPFFGTNEEPLKIKIKWDPEIPEVKPFIDIISRKEAIDLLKKNIGKNLIEKELKEIDEKIKLAISNCKDCVNYHFKYIMDKDDAYSVIKQLRGLRYDVTGLDKGKNGYYIFITWR